MFKKTLKLLLITIIFFLSFTALFSAAWYYKIYGNIGFQSILFTLLSPMEGTASNIVYSWLLRGLLPSVLCTAVLTFYFFYSPKKKMLFFKKSFKKAICICLCLLLWVQGFALAGIPKYLSGQLSSSTFYDKYYVSPADTKITFPDKKRNLIYILLESMETTYLSEALGGGLKENTIPELYALANENINFSHNSGVGGFGKIANTGWTSATIVAQTSGVPLSLPINHTVPKSDSNFLPNIKTINDILGENGYYQAFMIGSVASYGGRGNYFSQHSVDEIIEHSTAVENKIIPQDYFEWWGYEDAVLFEYAKSELTRISKMEQPFAFTMLTADTHHIAGYKCSECENKYSQQYENVIACSSKQIGKFIEWIKQQDFYDNTTVIICGDHLSMDAQFFRENTPKGYERHTYNCFINSAVATNNTKKRKFTPMDMFPTTLAAIGCEIDGERLGLGTNLFSNTKTLAEAIGVKKLNNELNKKSEFYVKNFIE